MDIERIIIAELIHCSDEQRIDAIIELEKIEFKNDTYKSLYQTIKELALAKKNVDIVSIYQTNQNIKAVEISKISDECISPDSIFKHIHILQEQKYKSDLIKIISSNLDLVKKGNFIDDIDELKSALISELSGISLGDKAEFENISEYKKQIESQLNSNKKIEGFSWGISDLDNWTSGIIPPRVYVIGGLKKSGKTRFLIHIIKTLLDQNIPNVFESMEMPAYEVTKLLHASYTGLNDAQFRSSSFMKKEDLEKFRSVTIDEKLFGLECKAGLKIDQILSRIRRYSKMGYRVIFIDYLQRIPHDRNKQAQELEDITIRLADACRQNGIALILLSQLNAAGEREAPNMGHLKGSGGIGEAADVIFLFDNLYRRTKEEKDKNKIDIYIEQRHGDSGKAEIWADLGSCRFNNLATENQLKEYNEIQNTKLDDFAF